MSKLIRVEGGSYVQPSVLEILSHRDALFKSWDSWEMETLYLMAGAYLEYFYSDEKTLSPLRLANNLQVRSATDKLFGKK